MKTHLIISALAILAIAAFGTPVFAQNGTETLLGYGFGVGGFLDENGDGFNDLAPDADGDGIPNGMDPDYAPPADGTGYQFGSGSTNGDGVCDGDGEPDGSAYIHMIKFEHRNGDGSGQTGFGPGDGTGNDGEGPGDGSGFGPGDGTCVPLSPGKGPERLN